MNSTLFVLVMVLASTSAISKPEPTKTGDIIGEVTMLGDGSLQMHLSSVDCEGRIAEAIQKYQPSDKGYISALEQVGGLERLQTKPLKAGPLEPCPPASPFGKPNILKMGRPDRAVSRDRAMTNENGCSASARDYDPAPCNI
ncbi:MAG: hypothetical protein JO056_05895 [Alphaproteobacteria bacterium]|jgi:hypothetical protein|uniref:hypothetical protein n=1 Tax=Bradyrhizobium sp. TaxID=376 RepID=UPI001ECDA826|nr:hypothetical protein [Bradyrhizobium sp.]MBV9570754.1 hypothetical protein [Alphaproteobacteria bacterium]MBV9979006.1 hypothetical protein [Bradyrhizobium sp.]